MAQFQFNAREVEPDQGRTGAIPAGWYATMVEKTELKPNSGGTGLLIAMQIGVIDGPYKGSKIFTNFNVKNDNEQAVEIGRKQLSALCWAVNVLDMHDTDQVKNIPFFTKVKVTPAVMDAQDPTKVKYEEKNETTAFRNQSDQAAAQGARETAAKVQGAKAAPAPVQQPQNGGYPQQPVQQQQNWAQPAAQQPVQQQQVQQPVQQQQQFQPQGQQPWPQPGQQPVQQQQFQPQAEAQPAGQPNWANQQPQFSTPPAAMQQQQQQPVATPEQQAAYAQAQSAGVPWGQPQQ